MEPSCCPRHHLRRTPQDSPLSREPCPRTHNPAASARPPAWPFLSSQASHLVSPHTRRLLPLEPPPPAPQGQSRGVGGSAEGRDAAARFGTPGRSCSANEHIFKSASCSRTNAKPQIQSPHFKFSFLPSYSPILPHTRRAQKVLIHSPSFSSIRLQKATYTTCGSTAASVSPPINKGPLF